MRFALNSVSVPESVARSDRATTLKSMAKRPPAQLTALAEKYPEVWTAFTALADACHENGGPLDEKSRRMAKLERELLA